MNIFFLDKNPRLCAEYHCNKHIVKMPLETAQLLCTVHWETGSEAPYRLVFKNHPCAKWTRQSLAHYRWLCILGLELCKEYTYRYEKIHKCQEILEWLTENEPNLEDNGFTEPPQCMPDKCKKKSVVAGYRKYYQMEKAYFAEWKKRNIPKWFKGE